MRSSLHVRLTCPHIKVLILDDAEGLRVGCLGGISLFWTTGPAVYPPLASLSSFRTGITARKWGVQTDVQFHVPISSLSPGPFPCATYPLLRLPQCAFLEFSYLLRPQQPHAQHQRWPTLLAGMTQRTR